ncbi:ThuA domain-containing protein [Lunatimonas salinarum]|uniref:ThuA domain-containing protein n=1 Tax=Lunatimonas salinarum TaxID=1774590 RepID=UPI001ADEC137|nr:ThuA domain-containing protein [Lunatimonas salinarum]
MPRLAVFPIACMRTIRKSLSDRFLRLTYLLGAFIFFSFPASVLAQKNQPASNGKVVSTQQKPIRVLVWDEQQPEQKMVYPDFLGNHLVQHLQKNPALRVSSAKINQPEQGLSKEVLDETDVLIWWGHVRHQEIPVETAKAIVDRVKEGRLSLIALHSAHWSLPFHMAMEERAIQDVVNMLPIRERDLVVPEFIQWRSNVMPSRRESPRFDTRIEKLPNGHWHVLLERPTSVFPACCTPMQPSTVNVLLPEHPIAQGLPSRFTIPETEMYDEPFHVPEPDEVILRETWAGGEHFRSGMTWRLGRGQVFYFRPGHETYRIFTEPEPLKILENASLYLGGQIQAEAEIKTIQGLPKKMLVFSKTSWYRHPAIPMTNDHLVHLGGVYGFEVDVTEDAEDFTDAKLAAYDVVLFISTTDIGKSLSAAQQEAFIQWYRSGKGFVAMHAAGVHHDTWDWYSELFGTDFDSDSEYVPARVAVDPGAKNHWLNQGLPETFTFDGDWLNFKRSVRDLPGVTILLTLDETTYDPVRPQFKKSGGKPMGEDHPMAWIREFEGGRFAYTMIGHDLRPLVTPFGEEHLMRMIRWAAGAQE